MNAEKINPLRKYPLLQAIFTTLVTVLAGYLGYEKVEQMRSQDVTVEVNVPGHEYADLHHGHQRDIERVIRKHLQEYH